MNKRAGNGHTQPTKAEVAQFEDLTIHELGRLIAAARIAFKNKQQEAKRLTRKP